MQSEQKIYSGCDMYIHAYTLILLHAAIQIATQTVYAPFNRSSDSDGGGSEWDPSNHCYKPTEPDSGEELMERSGND